MTSLLLAGRYRLGSVIGSGGAGEVRRARDEVVGRDVAVKLLRAGAAASDGERLRREVEYLQEARHPNLVAVLDAGTDGAGGPAWFVMELVGGPDLRTVLRTRGPMDASAVRRLLGGVLGALGAMHAAGLVHRDVTPANILLTADPFARWEAKLTDLGIAHRALSHPLTDVGRVVGTAAYLSPEQALGAAVGPAADVYALGLVALEALTGVQPFPGSAIESATARLVRSPAALAGLEGQWHEVLAAATAIDPAARPSAEDLSIAVRALPDDAGVRGVPGAAALAEGSGPTAPLPALTASVLTVGRATPPPLRRRRPVLLLGAGVVLILGAGTAGSVAVATARTASSSDGMVDADRSTSGPTATSAAPQHSDQGSSGRPGGAPVARRGPEEGTRQPSPASGSAQDGSVASGPSGPLPAVQQPGAPAAEQQPGAPGTVPQAVAPAAEAEVPHDGPRPGRAAAGPRGGGTAASGAGGPHP